MKDLQDGTSQKTKAAALSLLTYCRSQGWAGHDPYDALNSRIFRAFPIIDVKPARLVLTQAMKRCPINLRPLLLVPKTRNAKGLALFLSAIIRLSRAGLFTERGLAEELARHILDLRSPGTRHWCWGYSFPWQTRQMLVRRGAPNLVCTVFVANALLDWFEESGNPEYLAIATKAADYILEDLYWNDGRVVGLRYPTPEATAQVHNANFLGAALLCRVSALSRGERFLKPALLAARYSARCQREDGSWDYGEASTQRWVDNFHTGFNLCALRQTGRYVGTDEFEPAVRRGFDFYRAHFFREDGAPKYFHNRVYPLDVHSVAQSIITLHEFQDLDPANAALAGKVLNWAFTHLRDEAGYFYYQKLPYGVNRIPYMRWGQAWMLLALATALEVEESASGELQRRRIAPSLTKAT